jgi:transposase-like protein
MNCPRCQSENIKSYGGSWKCKDCLKAFSKHRRLMSIPLKDRPKCPECRADNPYVDSKGVDGERRWSCRACGRSYSERTARLVLNEIPNLEIQTE